jgi:hypothetical protein
MFFPILLVPVVYLSGSGFTTWFVLQMWDLGNQEKICTLKWESDITSFTVIEDTQLM